MLTRATQSRKEFPIRSALIFLFRDRLVPRNKSLVREVSFCSESTTSPCGLCTGWSALRIYMELFPVCIMRIPGKGKVCKYMTKSLPCGLVVWAWVRSMEELPPRSLSRVLLSRSVRVRYGLHVRYSTVHVWCSTYVRDMYMYNVHKSAWTLTSTSCPVYSLFVTVSLAQVSHCLISWNRGCKHAHQDLVSRLQLYSFNNRSSYPGHQAIGAVFIDDGVLDKQ